MSSFEDYFFKIPISKNSKSDWDDIIENSDDDLKLLRIFQARVCLLVNDLPDLLVTPERIAWISIWTRTFLMLDNDLKMHISPKVTTTNSVDFGAFGAFRWKYFFSTGHSY